MIGELTDGDIDKQENVFLNRQRTNMDNIKNPLKKLLLAFDINNLKTCGCSYKGYETPHLLVGLIAVKCFLLCFKHFAPTLSLKQLLTYISQLPCVHKAIMR